MPGPFREHIRAARRQLHNYMSVPALYFKPGLPARAITVRVHDKFLANGDLKGTSFHYAEIEDDAPRLVFMRSEVDPERGYYVSVEPGVAYFVDTPMAPDDITRTARCQRVSESQASGFPLPTARYAYGTLRFPTFGGSGG